MSTSAKPPTPKPVPIPTPATKAFWEGTQAGELRIQRCDDHGHAFLYPRIRCPQCGSARLSWVKTSGRGTLYSYIINHMAAPGWEGETPYVVAVVKLNEGPRLLSSLKGVPPDPAALKLDMALEVGFEPRGNQMLPYFKPVGLALPASAVAQGAQA